jgi:hypothetical protein
MKIINKKKCSPNITKLRYSIRKLRFPLGSIIFNPKKSILNTPKATPKKLIKRIINKQLRHNTNHVEELRHLVQLIARHLHRTKIIQLLLKNLQRGQHSQLGEMAHRVNDPIDQNQLSYSVFRLVGFVLPERVAYSLFLGRKLAEMLKHEQIDQNIRHEEQTVVDDAIGQLEKVKHVTLEPIRAAVQIPKYKNI